MTRFKDKLSGFLNTTGLIWLPIVISERYYKPHSRLDSDLTDGFEAHHAKLNSEQIKEVVQELSRLMIDEEKRQDKIESKALSLMGFIGLSSAFVIALVTLVGNVQYPTPLRQVIVVVYALILISLMLTIVLAIKAIRVGKYSFMSPYVGNIWQRSGKNEVAYHRDQARDLLKSYIYNRAIINDKAEFVSGAQDWFRNTILLLMFLTILIVITPLQPTSVSNASGNVISATPYFPTLTQTFTASPTVTTPTPSKTLTPIITPRP